METARDNQYETLVIRRNFNVSAHRLFEAWTSAQMLTGWFAPADEMLTEVLELDVRPGGRYRIRMVGGECEFHTVSGEYLEIIPDRKLIFTWQWEGDDGDAEMLIRLEFLDKGEGSQLLLTQERIPSQFVHDEHEQGWKDCLARLERKLAA